jgi:hypothetical protein
MHAERAFTPHRFAWQKGSGHLPVTGAPVDSSTPPGGTPAIVLSVSHVVAVAPGTADTSLR